MNFKDAIKRINKDFCNLFQAKYLKGLWGYNVGYTTVPANIAIMRKQLADWQLANDCSNSLCMESKQTGPIIEVISYGKIADPCTCVLNPPLSAFGPGCHNWRHLNVNEILIASFTR